MTPRGIRNNNPGNIRAGAAWEGLATPQEMTPKQRQEKEFAVFKSPWWGVRALARLLLNYREHHGLSTIAGIIERYAPSSENNVDAYVEHVCRLTGFSKYQSIDVREPETMRALVDAIIQHENGVNPYSWEIDTGLILAGVEPGLVGFA